MPKLSDPKLERFANEYHVDINRIDAIMRCGCWKYHDTTTDKYEEFDPKNKEHRNRASAIASRLLMDPQVIIRFNELEDAKAQHIRIKAVRLLDHHVHVLCDFTPELPPTYKDQHCAAQEIAKLSNFYAEDNKSRADAVGEMFKSIFSTKDDLPKNGRTEPTTPDPAETCG